ncbi:MAG: alpha/beta hydrolase family protein [Candidatus Aminicenantales bacterium]
MKKNSLLRSFALFMLIPGLILFASPAQTGQSTDQAKPQAQAAAPAAPKPMGLQDILAWKSITFAAVSPDGAWFMHALSPGEGDSEIVIRKTREDKTYRFPIGESPRSLGETNAAFSADSKWAAFLIYPDAREARKLRKDKKKITAKAAIVNLASGEKTEFENIGQFSFSGENPGWIALRKAAPEKKDKDAGAGTDLILRDLASGRDLNIGNVAEFAFDKSGRWLAWIVDAQGQSGNGIQVRNMATGAVTPLDSDKAFYKSLGWTEKGEGFAALKGKEDKGFEDKLNAVVAFLGFETAAGNIRKSGYDPKEDASFPAGMTISPNRAPRWTEDGEGLLFGIDEPKKKKEGEPGKTEEAGKTEGPEAKAPAPPASGAPDEVLDEDIPDLVLWHWQDKRLQSQQQVEEKRDADFSYLCVYRPKEKKFIRLADDTLRTVEPAPRDRYAVGTDDSPYALEGSLDGRRFEDIHVIDMKTGARKPAIKECRWFFGPSPDGTRLLYYRDGHFQVHDMASGLDANITKGVPASFINTEDDHNVVDPPVNPVGWVKGGNSVLLSDGWDVWNVPVDPNSKSVNLTANGRKDGIRYRRRFSLDPEEKGIDLAEPVYIGTYGEWTKKAGIARIDKGRSGAAPLLWDDAAFSRLIKAKKAETYIYTRETSRDYPDCWVSGADLGDGRRITEANPQQKEFCWSSGSILLDYTSAKGAKLQAALFLPSNYEKGKSYPCIVYIYEKLSNGFNAYTQPSAHGFNKSVYTSAGYAVLMPDITYTIDDPGMSAVWCVLPALDAAVASGVVDKSRVGLQGHSWGGYQTAFLVTQTDAFAAAVAGAPLTNMVSMYSSIYWNTGSANQPIFETSQGRFKGGYSENLEAYLRNSPVNGAAKVKTPLVILHNDKDGAVDWNQGIEYFNTLRRLGKPVVMLEYVGENHGLRKPSNQKDYGVRMRGFFDHFLMGKPAPEWWTKGVPYLKLKDGLKETAKELRLK